MRQGRITAPGSPVHAFYHAMNRIVDGLFLWGPADKDKFLQYMREYETFCGVRVVTFNIMDNHFHIVLEVPREPETPLTDEELLARIESLSGCGGSKVTRQQLTRFREFGQHDAAEALRRRSLARMWSLREFMKALEQRFTQWFNKQHERRGTLWQSRFKSVLVESEGEALATIAAYVDLNSVRARMAADPMHYRWCGYSQAILGHPGAQEGLRIVMAGAQRVAPESLSLTQAVEQYRMWFHVQGEQTEGTDETGQPLRAGFSAERVSEVIQRNGRVPPKDYVKLRVRYFSDGLAVGSKEFINGLFETLRPRWRKRKDGAKRMQGVESDNLYVLGKLRRDVVGWPKKVAQNADPGPDSDRV